MKENQFNPLQGSPVRPTYSKEVLEIHGEFFTASEQCLLEANELLNKENNRAILRKIVNGFKLYNLGFTNRKRADLFIGNDEKIKLLKAAQIEYYNIHYPMYKFISEEQVGIICKKWGLILGKINRYKGEIPEYNEQKIIEFNIKDEDKGLDVWSIGRGIRGDFGRVGDWENDDDGKLARSKYHVNCEGKDYYKEVLRPAKLWICAPKKDMDMTGITIEDEYKMTEIKVYYPDPIVLQPLKSDHTNGYLGGYLIVTAWGPEASDAEVLNPNQN